MARLIMIGVGLLVVAIGGGCGDPLVGGECAIGYVQQGSRCVHVSTPSGGAGGASSDAGASSSSGPQCTSEANPICASPLVACCGACVDTSSDPQNCGACGTVCETELCSQSVCQGSLPGQIVLVGMDYADVDVGQPAAVLLGNSVFLGHHKPARILDYREYADANGTAVANVLAIIANEGATRGRTVVVTPGTSAGAIPSDLDSLDYDVLLVEHQANAPSGVLGPIGASWAPSLGVFAKKGGVIVVLATTAGTTEMADFMTQAGLLEVTSLTAIEGEPVNNQNYLDAVGQNVLSPFLAKLTSAWFATPALPSARIAEVIADENGNPVVVHKIVVTNQGP